MLLDTTNLNRIKIYNLYGETYLMFFYNLQKTQYVISIKRIIAWFYMMAGQY